MPKGWAKKCTFGVIAQMSDTTNNHDLLGLHVDTDANDEDEDGLCAVVPCTNGGARAMLVSSPERRLEEFALYERSTGKGRGQVYLIGRTSPPPYKMPTVVYRLLDDN